MDIDTDRDSFIVVLSYAISTDYGVTWSFPKPLGVEADAGNISVQTASVAGDSTGFVFVWSQFDPTTNSYDIFKQRLVGGSLSAVEKLTVAAANGLPAERLDVSLAADGRGAFALLYSDNYNSANKSIGDRDILFALSNDNGVTFSAPTQLSSAGETDTDGDTNPYIVSDGDSMNLLSILLIDNICR